MRPTLFIEIEDGFYEMLTFGFNFAHSSRCNTDFQNHQEPKSLTCQDSIRTKLMEIHSDQSYVCKICLIINLFAGRWTLWNQFVRCWCLDVQKINSNLKKKHSEIPKSSPEDFFYWLTLAAYKSVFFNKTVVCRVILLFSDTRRQVPVEYMRNGILWT